MESFDVIVCGSGPAGLAASLAAASHGASTLVLEQDSMIGRKLCATGNGRCNFSNTVHPLKFMAEFGRNGRFMVDALRAAPREFFLDLLLQEGIRPKVEDEIHYFPMNGRASDVRDAFLRAARRAGAETRPSVSVRRVLMENGSAAGVETVGGEILHAPHVILACGGTAAPALGGSASGLELAKKLGHSIREPVAALAPVHVDDPWFSGLAGVTVPDAELGVAVGTRHVFMRGSLLFTHTGFSGPAALNLSGTVNRVLSGGEPAHIFLRVVPDKKEQDLFAYLVDEREKVPDHLLKNSLARIMPRSLASLVCERLFGEDFHSKRLTNAGAHELAHLLDRMPFTVSAQASMDEAMAMDGGVLLKEVDPRTMESRLAKGVHFAGEILDLTGPTGGFNIQFALSSGRLAGLAASGAL
ncbi:MAG: aminoacetone oxidase family FAD-binding enzyme [Lentisphaeria bacterium]|nr:aminoacetone oxidase family FAD-binding enzyme [Lentisphaeria bacterium]